MKKKNEFYGAASVLIAAAISLIIAFLIILFVSDNPAETMKAFIIGPFSSANYARSILTRASILIFTGLALTSAFRAGQFNMSIEGGVYLGGVAATAAALSFQLLPAALHIFLCLVAGVLAGGIFCAIPGILKHKFGADEFVTSLMLNYVALYLGYYVINSFFIDHSFGNFASLSIPEELALPKLISGTKLHLGLLLMAVVTVLVCLYLLKSKQGYQIRMIGLNPVFGKYSGLKVGFFVVLSQFLAGALAGLGGGVEILGMYTRFSWSNLPGYGWDGVIVAMLSRNNPCMVPVAAVFLAYLRIGSEIMATRSDIPTQLITVIQAIIMMLVTSSVLLAGIKRRSIVREALKNES